MNIQEITKAFNAARMEKKARENAIRDKIEKRELQTERLKKRLEKIEHEARPYWITDIILPITAELEAKHPDMVFEVFGPFGLSCTTSIHAYDRAKYERAQRMHEESKCVTDGYAASDVERGAFRHMISFRPKHDDDDLYVGILDRSKTVHDYAPDTLGAINELQYGTIPIESFEQVETLLFASKE